MAGISDFMDQQLALHDDAYLSPERIPSLAECGSASRRVAVAAGSRESAEQVLASLFWWCYVLTEDYWFSVLAGLGVDNPSSRRQIIVTHAQGALHNLLVLARGVSQPYAVIVRDVDRGSGHQASSDDFSRVALDEAGTLHAWLASAGIRVPIRIVPLAVMEVARGGRFGIVVAAEPEQVPTGTTCPVDARARVERRFVAPTPALAVCLTGESAPLATAGIIGGAQDGRVFAITARHAVAGVPGILVAGREACIVRDDVVTDTCLLALTFPAGAWPGVGLGGPLKITPAEHQAASFDGAASGHRTTLIRGYDLSVVDHSPYLSSKAYTEPDTTPGDSGAALIDSGDHIVGFAVSRTSFDSPVAFAAWSWADQVLTRHGLAWPWA